MRAAAGYDIVLKLFGIISQHQRALVATYREAAEPDGALSILYDTGGARVTDPMVEACSTRKAARPCAFGADVRVCLYSFERIKARFPLMQRRFNNISRGLLPQYARKFLFTGRNFAVEPPLVLLRMGLLDGCRDRPSRRRFIWTVEADAAFVGPNVRTFFDAFRTDGRDLLSTGFQIADTRWWARYIHTFPRPFLKKCSTGWACFGRGSSIPALGEPLGEPLCGGSFSAPKVRRADVRSYYELSISNDLKWAAGQCKSTARGGALFRLVVVERYSSRLLDHLGTLLDDGRFAASETFSSTACALKPWCTIGDWAMAARLQPNGSRNADDEVGAGHSGSFASGVLGARGFRSPHYYYYPARFADVTSWCEACDCADAARMRNRWVHPVGELKDSRQFKQEHPAVWERHQRLRAEDGGACMARFPQCVQATCAPKG